MKPTDPAAKEPPQKNHIGYQFFILALSVWAIGALFVSVALPSDSQGHAFLEYADLLVCVFFLVDFAVTLATGRCFADESLRKTEHDLFSKNHQQQRCRCAGGLKSRSQNGNSLEQLFSLFLKQLNIRLKGMPRKHASSVIARPN